ncbi:hypothetical protein [Pleionea sediminis]|uniref:hypothetical protein n=1 Tax=Pleionea sediminis TaxID=2569479 RepID=UPI0011863999|nr:hypothetical protein [Pleionea sediminis]
MNKLTSLSLVTAMALSSAAQAVNVVKYSDGRGYAYGVLQHNTTSAHITCARSHAVPNGTSSGYDEVWCSARDLDGNSGFCFTSNADFTAMMQGLSDHGRLLFRWNSSGECYAMQLTNSTNYLPAP